jgi:hypothetical protein
MATAKYVWKTKQKALTPVQELADRLGVLNREIKRRTILFKQLRARLLKMKKKGKISGESYNILIQAYEVTSLDESKVKKYVDKKVLKKCYTTTEATRVKIKPR